MSLDRLNLLDSIIQMIIKNFNNHLFEHYNITEPLEQKSIDQYKDQIAYCIKRYRKIDDVKLHIENIKIPTVLKSSQALIFQELDYIYVIAIKNILNLDMSDKDAFCEFNKFLDEL